jgi:hypothetical protein
MANVGTFDGRLEYITDIWYFWGHLVIYYQFDIVFPFWYIVNR